MSFYDTCLFITKDKSVNFDIIELWTNNIHNVGTKIFINKKKTEIIKAKF